MEIQPDGNAKLTFRERAILGIDDEQVPLAELRLAQRLNDLIAQRDTLAAEAGKNPEVIGPLRSVEGRLGIIASMMVETIHLMPDTQPSQPPEADGQQ
mgnify:FL=1